jgi:hypothetical protein
VIQNRPAAGNDIKMKTLHITKIDYKTGFFKSSIAEHKSLMSDLYKRFLINDDHFHFFYEPDIIIRISDEGILKQISDYLASRLINFLVYDYPAPQTNQHHECYGEDENGVVIRNLSLFIPIFHANSVAALSMSQEDHFLYMERVIHTMWNPAAYTRAEEGAYLGRLASYKLDDENVSDASGCCIL